MSRLWRDTLFRRLFLLMWGALVASHLIAVTLVTQWLAPSERPWQQALADASMFPRLPPTPGLPGLGGGPPRMEPGSGPSSAEQPPHQGGGLSLGPWLGPWPDGGGMGERSGMRGPRALPTGVLLFDYAVRFLIIGLAAWWGARWLSDPMRRLVAASAAMAAAIGREERPPMLGEQQGTVEVREAARVFNDMARELDAQFKGRGLLVAAISHDLRTPLTRIRLRLESLEHEPAGRRCIADVHEMSELIDSVLEVFRGDGFTEPPRSTDVLALVQALGDDLVEQGHAVTTRGEPMTAEIQPAAFKRALSNLMSNALRYGGRADVALAAAPGGLDIVIDDAGPGIPAAQIDAVFEPFYRVERSRDRRTGGTGLGLYIARDLIERQGGTLTLANRPEGGLRATVFLPLA